MKIARLTWVFPLLALLLPGAAVAADYLSAEPFGGKKVNIDGALLEWPGGFAKLGHKVSGSAGEVQALVAYDQTSIYVAARIKDSHISRTAAAGTGEDKLSLEIYFPKAGGGGTTRRLDIFPGDPGKLPAVVKLDGKALTNAQAVEAPDATGFVLEAQIPWSVLSEAQLVRVGLRGRLSYSDASSPGHIKGVVSNCSSPAEKAPPLTLEPETGLIQALLEPKQLSLVPAREAYGDVSGGSELERVALYGHFLSIVGPGYRDGKQFYFNELDVERADQVTRLELRDFNGDGKAEIVLGKRLGNARAYREVLQVLQIGADGAPLQVFIHETALVTDEGSIENKITIDGKGKEARVTVAQGKSEGFEASSFREPTLGAGIPSALLPWQTVGAQIYGWKGQGLALFEEKSFEPKLAQASGKKKGAGAAVAASGPKSPPAPRPPTADEMQDRVYALYRKDRGVGAKKPRFDFAVDVVEDGQNERVVVHDKDIVLFGKGFKSGTSYASITVGVKESKDILGVTALDLTGDGKAEIIVHAVLEAQASREPSAGAVQRQMLFVYGVLGDTLTRIFAAETGRALKKDRVLGSLLFLPSSRGTVIEIGPLFASGWTEKTYPFPQDDAVAGGPAPLLLPWNGEPPRRYEFDGKSFVAR